jgi:hypothetical protein
LKQCLGPNDLVQLAAGRRAEAATSRPIACPEPHRVRLAPGMDADEHSSAGRMEGGGYYTEHSEAQEAYGEPGFEWLEQAAAEVDPPAAPLPFAIADMGAAGDGNSLEPMAQALAARRGEGPALVVHTDIPTNDFSALFQLVNDSPKTYVEDGVFPSPRSDRSNAIRPSTDSHPLTDRLLAELTRSTFSPNISTGRKGGRTRRVSADTTIAR